METTGAAGEYMLVKELTQGHGLARELKSQLNSASVELCKCLAQEILASIEKAISMAKSNDSPCSLTGSHRGESPDPPTFKPDRKNKKTQPKWTKQVKLGSGPEAEGPLDDGYYWRKYGQKDILGAKFPKGYYRCAHRNTQGCPAIKQVQRSEDNQDIFRVTYRGTHTCRLKSSSSSPPATAGTTTPTSSFPNPNHHSNSQLLLSFQTNLKVETESLDSKYHQEPSSSSFFPSTPVDGAKPESRVFSSTSTPDNCFKRSFTDAFISPATPESDFTEIISGVMSSNSCMLDLDFLTDEFPFDTMSFFS